jgi:hypothetical protein
VIEIGWFVRNLRKLDISIRAKRISATFDQSKDRRKMQNLKIPDRSQVKKLGAAHNPLVWRKHYESLSEGPSKHLLRDVLNDCEKVKDCLSRAQVTAFSQRNLQAGVMASVIWGFPKGSLPGGVWKNLAYVFERSDRYAETLRAMKAEPNLSAAPGIQLLNKITEGVGFATTSKIAYFAQIRFSEGDALIYDRNVMLAIKDETWCGQFTKTRKHIGKSEQFYSRGVPTYGSFIQEASLLAYESNCDSDQIEAALFLAKVNTRSNWRF